MSGQPWYRHNPRDFLDGIVGMTPDLIGAYIVTLDLIYARGGPIPNDARWLGGAMGCKERAAAGLVQRLLDAGKLSLVDGALSNVRAANEIQNAEQFSKNQIVSGGNGGRKRAENEAASNELSELSQATLKPIHNSTEHKKEKRRSNDLSATRCEADDIATEWNGMAKASGLPLVARLTPERRMRIKARLVEHDRAAFTEAIGKIGASEFCRGSNFASLDWLTKPANFLKVIEGNYDDRPQRVSMGRNDRLPPERPTETSNPRILAGIANRNRIIAEQADHDARNAA